MARYLALLILLLTGGALPQICAAESEIDGDLNLNWWSNTTSADALDASFDVGSAGGDAELWWRRRWGMKGSLYKSDVVENQSAQAPDYLSVDFKRRLFSATRNNFLALGLGWESIDLGNGSDTHGPRFLLEGRLGVTPMVSLYGHTAWLPKLEETNDFEDPDGLEIEAGLAVKPLPHLSFRAGYREFRLDFKSLEGVNESSKSKGVIFGAGIHW